MISLQATPPPSPYFVDNSPPFCSFFLLSPLHPFIERRRFCWDGPPSIPCRLKPSGANNNRNYATLIHCRGDRRARDEEHGGVAANQQLVGVSTLTLADAIVYSNLFSLHQANVRRKGCGIWCIGDQPHILEGLHITSRPIDASQSAVSHVSSLSLIFPAPATLQIIPAAISIAPRAEVVMM